MGPRDTTPRIDGSDWQRRGRTGPRKADRVGWATWTLCGTLTGLVVGASLWHGRAAVTPGPDPATIRVVPSAAVGVPIQPGTVWVALATQTYYRPDQPGFGQKFPGVFMPEMQAIARGCWPALEGPTRSSPHPTPRGP